MKYLVNDPVRDVIGHDQVQLVHLVVHLKTNLRDKFNKYIEKNSSYINCLKTIGLILVSIVYFESKIFVFQLSKPFSLFTFIATFFWPSTLLQYPCFSTPWIGVLLDDSNCLLLVWGACIRSHNVYY